MIAFRHADTRLPFLWEDGTQPAARWHGEGEGPVQYFADTPDGAWAEFLRHEEITDPEDLATVERAMWAVDVPDEGYTDVQLPLAIMTGGADTYPACQAEAHRLAQVKGTAIRAPSAALKRGGAAGWRVELGLQQGPARDGVVYALFGPQPNLIGWRASVGRPSRELLPLVRHFTDSPDT